MIGLLVVILSVGGVLTNQTSSTPAVTCPPITSDSAVQSVTCLQRLTFARVDCTRAMVEGTVAVTQCKKDYFADDETSKTSQCRRDGRWTNGHVTCKPRIDCGRQGTVTTSLIAGEQVKDGELPWNINIYRRDGPGWHYWCPGTLITPTHVITSAWCVINATYDLYPAANLTLAARKLHQHYDTVEPNSQLRSVNSVVRHEDFVYDSREYNIGILVANQSFVLSSHVTVACLDWSTQRHTPSYSDILIGAAWTQGINGEDRWLLAAQSYTLVGRDTCKASIESLIREYVTEDKYCARTTNRDTCEDSRGGGLMVQQDGRYYLSGVLSRWLAFTSSEDGCSINRLNSYTKIAKCLPWIGQQIPDLSHSALNMCFT